MPRRTRSPFLTVTWSPFGSAGADPKFTAALSSGDERASHSYSSWDGAVGLVALEDRVGGLVVQVDRAELVEAAR